jgi:hypothetical protein
MPTGAPEGSPGGSDDDDDAATEVVEMVVQSSHLSQLWSQPAIFQVGRWASHNRCARSYRRTCAREATATAHTTHTRRTRSLTHSLSLCVVLIVLLCHVTLPAPFRSVLPWLSSVSALGRCWLAGNHRWSFPFATSGVHDVGPSDLVRLQRREAVLAARHRRSTQRQARRLLRHSADSEDEDSASGASSEDDLVRAAIGMQPKRRAGGCALVAIIDWI